MRFTSLVIVVALTALPAAAFADNATAPSSGSEQSGQPTPRVSEKAEQILQAAGRYLQSAGQFTFHAEITFDQVLLSGQKLQFAASEQVALRRPDRLFVDYDGDIGSRRLWYDGKTLTLFSPDASSYAAAEMPADLDATLDKAAKELGFAPPLSDFLYSDPSKVLRDVLYGSYVGQGDVAGTRCHHLAFIGAKVDWQIWIEDGPQWVPRKVVITYRDMPGQPQFAATFTAWDLAPRIADILFKPDLPTGVDRIAFKSLASDGGQP